MEASHECPCSGVVVMEVAGVREVSPVLPVLGQHGEPHLAPGTIDALSMSHDADFERHGRRTCLLVTSRIRISPIGHYITTFRQHHRDRICPHLGACNCLYRCLSDGAFAEKVDFLTCRTPIVPGSLTAGLYGMSLLECTAQLCGAAAAQQEERIVLGAYIDDPSTSVGFATLEVSGRLRFRWDGDGEPRIVGADGV